MIIVTCNDVFVKENLYFIWRIYDFKKKQHMGQKRFVSVCDISCCWYGTGLETSEEDLEVLCLTGARGPIEMR